MAHEMQCADPCSIATGVLDGESSLDETLIRFGNSFHGRRATAQYRPQASDQRYVGPPWALPSFLAVCSFGQLLSLSLISHLC